MCDWENDAPVKNPFATPIHSLQRKAYKNENTNSGFKSSLTKRRRSINNVN